jgi:hypothetical protein
MVAIISQVIAFYAVELNFEIPQLWKDNLAAKCNPQPLFKTFQYKSFIYAGITPAAYTAYLGMLLKEKLFSNVPTGEDLLKTDIGRFLLRILVIGVLGAPFGLLFFLVPWSVSSIWVLLLFKTLTPCLGSMLLIFTFSDYLFLKMKLVDAKASKHYIFDNTSLQMEEPLLGNEKNV